MDLPRFTSQSSLTQSNNPPSAGGTLRPKPLSQRINFSNVEPSFAILPVIPGMQPSRKREEAKALHNLRCRLRAVKILEINRPEPIVNFSSDNVSPSESENRPHLLQKVLNNQPVSMVLDISDLRTAWQDSDFISECLCWHNVYRQRHNSPSLTMSAQLCHLAQEWANHLAHTNRFYYRSDKDIGQNLYFKLSNGIDNTDVTGQEVANYWYSGVKQFYKERTNNNEYSNVNTGHFTQMIWASSRRFGIGKARSRTGKVVVVAHYYPVGNVTGHYSLNVLPPTMEYSKTQNSPMPTRFKLTSESTGSRSYTSSSTDLS